MGLFEFVDYYICNLFGLFRMSLLTKMMMLVCLCRKRSVFFQLSEKKGSFFSLCFFVGLHEFVDFHIWICLDYFE